MSAATEKLAAHIRQIGLLTLHGQIMRTLLKVFAALLIFATPAYATKQYAVEYATTNEIEVYNPTNPPPSSGASIGGAVTGGTDTAIPFIHPDSTLAQDVTHLHFDPTNFTLYADNASFGGAQTTIGSDGTISLGTVYQIQPSGAFNIADPGYFNFTGVFGQIQGLSFLNFPTAGSLQIANNLGTTFVTIKDTGTIMTVAGGFSAQGIIDTVLGTNLAVYCDGSNVLQTSTCTATELGYVHGSTSSLQTQINTKVTDTTVLNGDFPMRLSGSLSRVVRNGSATKMFLFQTGDGGGGYVSGGWGQPAAANLSDGTTGSGGGVVLATGPTLSNPVVGTQSSADNTTKAASTAYVTTAITNLKAAVNTWSAVQTFGGIRYAYVAKSANYTITTADYFVDCTANSFTITLPTAASVSGETHIIKNSGTGLITINTTSAQTVDGLASGASFLRNQYQFVQVTSDNANWKITGGDVST